MKLSSHGLPSSLGRDKLVNLHLVFDKTNIFDKHSHVKYVSQFKSNLFFDFLVEVCLQGLTRGFDIIFKVMQLSHFSRERKNRMFWSHRMKEKSS